METDKSGHKEQLPNPRTTASIFSIPFFWWVTSFIWLGTKRELQVSDLYRVLPSDESEKLGIRLQREWEKELQRYSDAGSQKKRDPSLNKALIRTFGLKFGLLGLVSLFQECFLKIVQPLCLGQVITYFNPGSQTTMTEAYLYATGVILCPVLFTLTAHPNIFETMHIGMQLRVSTCSLLYKKSLRLSQKGLAQTTIGQMTNLMSNDVSRFDLSVAFMHYLWVGPLQAIITTVILFFYIGPSCLAGLGLLILFVPFQSALGRIFSKLRMKTAKRTDERVRTMNEILTGMRVIKMYTWEKPFTILVELCRKLEVNVIRKTALFRAFNLSLFFTSSKLIVFLTFVAYVLSGNTLTPNKVFLTVALFNNVRLIMTNFFPQAISFLAEVMISVKRIQTFLMLEETEINSQAIERSPLSECVINLEKVTVKWPAAKETEDNTLTDVSFTVHPGQILAVVGQVGSGKSSLLNVLLGELALLEGSRQVKGKIAYASQEPWIFSGTIRQNILSGLEYNEERYNRVIKVAALERDLRLFPRGDGSPLGERGVQLSGGQKARVNLARCLYVDADIYIMDDPLSAVDTHVGRHLFDQAINGFLRNKIRVLVTHQLQYLRDVDQILALKSGRVEGIGTYDELSKGGFDLAKTVEEDDEESSDDDEGDIEANGVARSSTRSQRSTSSSIKKEKRRASQLSRTSIHKGEAAKPAFAEESRSSGRVTLAVYGKYVHSGGGYISFMLLVLSSVLAQALFSATDYWLNLWTNAEQLRANSTTSGNVTEQSWQEEIDTTTGIYVYSILVLGVFIFSLIRTVHLFFMCLFSSVKLHNEMFHSIIRSPLLFFDRNPVGRILNRFSKDIGCMDDQLPPTLFDVVSIFLAALGIVVVVGVVNPWLILPVVFMAIFFYKFRQIYLKAARGVKRLEATAKSPIFTHLSSSLVGLTTLRAHNYQGIFQQIFDNCQDVHSSAWYLFLAANRWFGVWLDWVTVFYVACVTYTCVGLHESFTSSEAGLVISSAMSLTGMVQWGMRQSAEVENQMTSVERVIEYGNLPSEAPFESSADKKPSPDWPSEGSVKFEEMSLRYSETDPPVLKCITCQIKPKEKVGIVGRTGAGKSSLIASLFRLTEPEGRIFIDGIDTKSIGLHDLRSQISIIPQDPFLFSGSLRRNLDPFSEFNDDVLWNALEDVKLKESMTDSSTAGLDFIVTEGGANLSVGQRQLVCLARAILRKNRILILDEATANVDQKTDSLIQLTIRDKFHECTVLTVAHRLNTIMDSDRIMVMDSGSLREFDEPVALLENSKSLFYGLVEQTGNLAAELTNQAKQAAEQRRNNLLMDSTQK